MDYGKENLNTFSVLHPSLDTNARILVISDIHGNLPYFQGLIQKLELRSDDQLILLGDLIEKGPQSLATLRYAMELQKQCRVYPVLGNCDFWHLWVDNYDFAKEFRVNWEGQTQQHLLKQQSILRPGIILEMCQELGITLSADTDFQKLKKQLAQAFPKELAFLASMPYALQTEDYTFVHGGIPAGQSLEESTAWQCMKVDRFYQDRPIMDRWTVVGHTPVCLYHDDYIDAKPIIDSECKLISIDGGCVLKDDGQLNALIIDQGEFSYTWYDPFPNIIAEEAQEQSQKSAYIRWGDNQVELISSANDFSLIQHLRTGYEMQVPSDFLYTKNDILCVTDCTDFRPEIHPGDVLSLVRETSQGCWIKKDGITGWYGGEYKLYDSEIAISAMKKLNASAKASGSSNMTLDEINAEIKQYRTEQK